MKNNKKGSTIVTAIVVTMIVFIILGVALTIASSYQQRAINEHARKQAYLTGISVCDVIAGEIQAHSDDFVPNVGDEMSLYSHVDENEDKKNKISLPQGIGGEVEVTIHHKSEDILTVLVKSTYNKQVEKVQLTMQKQNNQWVKKYYSKEGEVINEEQIE